jgi:hypothetical protein
VFTEVCGEVGDVCEETLADLFAELQMPVLNVTCMQRKKNRSLAVPLLTVLNTGVLISP